jgi:hypothetical protein
MVRLVSSLSCCDKLLFFLYRRCIEQTEWLFEKASFKG